MPENVSFSGENWTLYFVKAVERTALQFPQVEKVSVCLDGELDLRAAEKMLINLRS